MKRKLIKQGMSGCTIYLPKNWVDSRNLKPGDDVSVEIVDQGLLISSEKRETAGIEITLDDTNRKDIKPLLTHAYRKGVDQITFHDIDDPGKKTVKDVLKNTLLGFDIIEEKGNSLILGSISEPDAEKYDVLLQRVFFILQELQKLLTQEGDAEELVHQADKYILFCRRTISKHRLARPHSDLEWELLTFLMHISHNYKYLIQYKEHNKLQYTKKTRDLIEALGTYLDHFVKAFLGKNITHIHTINSQKTKWQFGACYDALNNAKGKEAGFLGHVREQFRWIQIATSPLLGVLLRDSPPR